uniref:ATP synthase F0 subunit 6 n=1 Tax=Rhabdias kafunata TaxID=2605646 RepID=UPI0023D8B51C|nr:ATP synthase F0 subunit 6 [Rhabdias kafunata]WCQ82422.1 ATP synthase F0 subunit 6 [Rhabdias kafunata]
MNQVYFLDIFMFFFVLQYLFYFKESMMNILVSLFLKSLVDVFSYTSLMPMSSLISIFTFIILLVCCFGGYFTYSFCPCGMLNFTFIYASVAWMSTLLTFISSEKFSVYMSKSGDSYLKTLVLLAIESVSEFSRPMSLTIRLTVNIMVGHLISSVLYKMFELMLMEKYVWICVLAIMMECFVFFIQSYVFSRLVYLYLNE